MLLRITTTPQSLLSSLALLHCTTKPSFFPKTLHFSRHCTSSSSSSSSSSAALVEPSTLLQTLAPSSTLSPHPWPEWVSFIDRLKSRGYFSPSSSSDADHDLVYREIRLLKDPCLSFARDRYDVFKSLSKDDIQNIVETGCPKLIRKVVNSAKRLRMYVGLEEKNVCEVCSLRGSCDRAYLKPNEADSVQTVDIMRLLMFYALDPMVISGAVRPPNIEQAETSVRKLLSMLMDLSETYKDPASAETPIKKEKIVNPTATVVSQAVEIFKGEWFCPKCSFLNFSRNIQCHKCDEPRPKQQARAHVDPGKGSWSCPQCNFLNSVRNTSCRKCNEDPLKKRERQHVETKKGDWHCPKCKFLNYSKNIQCRKCNQDAPKKRESEHVDLKKGDWNCPECGRLNFARRTVCLHCTRTRPVETLNPGDWLCPKCYFLNFRRNASCLKCEGGHVKEAEPQVDHIWVKPNASHDGVI